MDFKKRDGDEDLTLMEKVLFPLGVAAGLLGMGIGLMICLQLF
jgi:hypothetical protein